MTSSSNDADKDANLSNAENSRSQRTATTLDQLAWDKRGELLSKCWATIRYHRRRAQFFDRLEKVSKVITIAFAMTFLAQLEVLWTWLKPVIGSLIGLVTLLDLIFGYGDKKNAHLQLADQSAKVIEAIELVPIECIDTADAARWGALYSQVVANEPPLLKNLKMVCEHEQFLADGEFEHAEKYRPVLSWLDLHTLNFLSDGTSTEKWRAEEKARRRQERERQKIEQAVRAAQLASDLNH